MNQKHIHFIGICGVAMSALALACHKKGWKVTGSDKGFYPPVSTYLKEAGVKYYPGWHPEKMTADGNPDLVVVGNVAGSQNLEWLYVQKHNIPHVSYPEFLGKEMITEKSIVCAGTYGKSTSTALLTWILKEAGMDPNYMFGGISRNDIPAAALTDSEWSVVEGDEYKTARWDNRAKFYHYSPTHLMLTAAVWDHADIYPTEKEYVHAFEDLVGMVPADGLIVISGKVKHKQPQMLDIAKSNIVTYGKTDDNDYQYTNVQTSKDGTSFDIMYEGHTYHAHTNELGDYMPDNMTGCFAMAHQIGIDPEKIIAALASFKSVKRRLEKRLDGDVVVLDDIAHSNKKAEAVLRSLRDIYDGKIIAVYEPNTGNRQHESIPGYDNAFKNADIVIVPRLTRIKRDPNKPAALDGQELANVIAKTHADVRFIEDDDTVVSTILEETTKGDIVAFLGSRGFRGMIDEVTAKLSS